MIQFLQLFLSLTILITLHEFGHFYFAKKFKCRVDKFYLFFDFLFPFAGIMNFSLFKKKIGGTEYGLGWFPFGGYVQIAGMVDEQMDKTNLEKAPEPWEFRAKPAWQRLLIMIGGILVNFILGILIYWMILFVWGKTLVPVDKLTHGIACDSVALRMGLQNGDKIVSVDNKPVKYLDRVTINIIMDKAQSIQVNRNGEMVNIPISEDDISVILKNAKKSRFISIRRPFYVDSVMDGYAKNAGIKKGDRIIGVNGNRITFFDELQLQLALNKGKSVDLDIIRGSDTTTKKSMVSKEGTINIGIDSGFDPSETLSYGFGGAFVQGFDDGMEDLLMNIKQFAVIFTVKDAHKQVGGFYTMWSNMPTEWDWYRFWKFTGFLSLVLAFMNFLPIPMLDGGYILFVLIEMVTRRKIPEKVVYYANYVGLIFILGLMIYANTDWARQ